MLTNDVTLILTCCVSPNVANPLWSGTPELRESQYREAIGWYLKNTNYDIIVSENSGFDLSNGFEDYSERTEFLTYCDNGKNGDRGKGYKEMEILEYVYHNSKTLKKNRGG